MERVVRDVPEVGLIAIAIRVTLFALFGGAPGDHILLQLPVVPLPSWMAGVRLGGPITLEGVLASAYDGMRLGVIFCCIGAANALTSPRRLLKSLPGALTRRGRGDRRAGVRAASRRGGRPVARRPQDPRSARQGPASAAWFALAALLLVFKVFFGFERQPVERHAKRWVIVADQQAEADKESGRGLETATAVESEGQNPAA